MIRWLSDGGGERRMALGRQGSVQGALLIGWQEVPSAPGHVFYDRLNAVLDRAGLIMRSRISARRTTPRAWGGRRSRPGATFGCYSSVTSRAWTASAGSPGAAPAACRCGSS